MVDIRRPDVRESGPAALLNASADEKGASMNCLRIRTMIAQAAARPAIVLALLSTGTVLAQSSAAELFDERWLAETAADLSRSLPQQIDAETRLDGVTAGPGRRLNYRYTLVNRNRTSVDVESFNANMQPLLRASICGKAGMQGLLKNGVTLAYNYLGGDGKLISMIEILPQHCG
jgi:hypothetical protein